LNQNILFLGLGEVGNSVLGLYNPLQVLSGVYNLYFRDLTAVTDKAVNIEELKDYINIDVLHVSIPYSQAFKDIVIDYIKKYKPSLTLIHSTVDIGTTRAIAEQSVGIVAHTPVMGVHPTLTKSMQTFRKIVGIMKAEDKETIMRHLSSIKVIPDFYNTPEDSEAAKMMSTTYYGHNIRFMQDVHKFCEEQDLDFEKVYTRTNEIYNRGYTEMEMPNVRRPVLKYTPGKIGGHCVVPNAELLSDRFELAKELVEHNDNL